MRSDEVFSILGITQKAGKLISGLDCVERSVNANKVFLIIMSKDTSGNTQKKIKELSTRKNVAMISWGNSDELGRAIGKKKRKVIGITDKGIAKEIFRRINLLTGVGDID
ncbi:ribosomal L7Ae/L30e/S12e/Gadd45 family protein [Tepidanaerobacter sp. EBM-38]|uniref:L7Ae/L30e/S12e/Gadd45 family ribosomal protein n=1 Tax=Tepidanaerobacter sp. EBM-38 TaxID=1918496 RepID=UPI000A5800A0|nr:ribosomal L7Ae/L30e/S12e/Gadd45 family protein [Tepidanaerobacter sp. EBM-38]